MDVRTSILITIIASGVVTLLPRVLPLLLMRRMSFPRWYQDWLGYLPVTIMSALVAQELLTGSAEPGQGTPLLAATAISLVCAAVSRSLFVTVVAGVLAFHWLHLWLN